MNSASARWISVSCPSRKCPPVNPMSVLWQWAAGETDRQGAQFLPDEIERALFEGEVSR